MVPHNAAHPSSQPFGPFAHSTQSSPLDSPAFDMLSSPHVAKQMAALSAANQARIAQNVRTGPPPPTSGTSSGAFLGGIHINNNNASNGSGRLNTGSLVEVGQELETHTVHSNFETAPNNRGLTQTPHSATTASFPDHPMSQSRNLQQQQQQQQHNPSWKQRQFSFLQQIATLHARRGNPLPPQLTGVPTPTFDPATTSWTMIEPSQEVGNFLLAGKDVDLFKLWTTVISHGGSQVVINANGWASFLPLFDLPEEFAAPNGNVVSLAPMLFQIYMQILAPFEESYKKNVAEQQKKAQASAQRPGGMPGAQFAPPPNLARSGHGMTNMQQSGMRPPMNVNGAMSQPIPPTNGSPYNPMHNQHRPSSSQNPNQISTPDSHIPMNSALDIMPHTVDSNLLDQDIQGIKRKHEPPDADLKRVRQKTDPPESHSMSMMPDESVLGRQNSQSLPATNGQVRPRQQAARRKIEYVPLKREVESYGGRDLRILDQEYHSMASRRPMREVNDWGTLELDWLSMSIRSRLSIELSYALTTFCVISTMRSQTPQTGFPLKDCPDLLEDSLDLVEELAYGEAVKKTSSDALDQPRLFTNRELVSYVRDSHGQPFASLRRQQGCKDPNLGPTPRPADLIMLVVDIIRNLTVVDNNLDFIAQHPRAMDILLRLCCVEQVDGQSPVPSSHALSLVDVLYIRREVVNIIVGVGKEICLSGNSTAVSRRTTRRIVDLLASYLVDPLESIPPMESIQMAGVAPNHSRRPSALADTALEAFTKFSTVDENRPAIAQVVPAPTLWLLLECLLRRLPVTDADFQLMQRDPWIAYIEKIIASIYTIIFISPPVLKHKIKTDRTLGFKHVMLRVAQRILQHEGRCGVAGRRAIESIKLLDGNEETTSSDQQTPALAFGMGFEDGGDAGMEKGMGLLGGSRDMAWEMLFMREVLADDVVFMELDSLQRVDCS